MLGAKSPKSEHDKKICFSSKKTARNICVINQGAFLPLKHYLAKMVNPRKQEDNFIQVVAAFYMYIKDSISFIRQFSSPRL